MHLFVSESLGNRRTNSVGVTLRPDEAFFSKLFVMYGVHGKGDPESS